MIRLPTLNVSNFTFQYTSEMKECAVIVKGECTISSEKIEIASQEFHEYAKSLGLRNILIDQIFIRK